MSWWWHRVFNFNNIVVVVVFEIKTMIVVMFAVIVVVVVVGDMIVVMWVRCILIWPWRWWWWWWLWWFGEKDMILRVRDVSSILVQGRKDILRGCCWCRLCCCHYYYCLRQTVGLVSSGKQFRESYFVKLVSLSLAFNVELLNEHTASVSLSLSYV